MLASDANIIILHGVSIPKIHKICKKYGTNFSPIHAQMINVLEQLSYK
jgi:hypothetical protein